jgi:threonine synthase
MATFTFRCFECGARYSEREVQYVCPACATAQKSGAATRGVLEVVLDERPQLPRAPAHDPETLARLLPIASAASLPPLPVGGTPLLPVPRLRAHLGMPHLWVKDDTRNPSGSTKDRASQLVVAKAVEYGHDTIACASTGNAATALACLAAAAGVRAMVFVPAAAPPAKLVQIAAYGATLVLVEGTYDQAFELCALACERFGWYNRNTAFNPFTIEGKKTAGVEIAAQLAPERADVVVVPVGDGVIVSGVAKGFADVLDTTPRLLAVQPEGSGAIAGALRACEITQALRRRAAGAAAGGVKPAASRRGRGAGGSPPLQEMVRACEEVSSQALSSGAREAAPLASAASIADSLVVNAPRNAAMALARVRASGGTGVVVPDTAIVTAIALLARTCGVFAEPAGAAALAGLLVARSTGLVAPSDRVVLLVTGNGLKDIAAARGAVSLPRPIAPELAAVADLLRR